MDDFILYNKLHNSKLVFKKILLKHAMIFNYF